VLLLENSRSLAVPLIERNSAGIFGLCFDGEFQPIEHDDEAAVATLWRALVIGDETPEGWPRRRLCGVGHEHESLTSEFRIRRADPTGARSGDSSDQRRLSNADEISPVDRPKYQDSK
jgi:hypothetical protein